VTHRAPIAVLVIDADNVRRGLLACTLPPGEYAVAFAKTAELGLDLLNRIKPAVVIVGLDDSSADLCQRIRQLPAGESCLIAVTDERFRENTAYGMVGADAALPFPFAVTDLQRLLADHGSRARAETRRMLEAVAAAPTTRRRATREQPRLAVPPAEPAPDAWSSFAARVDELHRNLAALDYFELLGVTREANLAEIKEAYFRRSIAFHPDRFERLQDEALKRKNYEVYKRISEAFRVLNQPEARAAYEQDDLDGPRDDRSVRYRGSAQLSSAVEDRPPTRTTMGTRYLRFAELAREAGNLKSAKMYLTLALQWEPECAPVRQALDEITREMTCALEG
jgi:CheY-like chemotaxis protein